jgi:SAM-dependent methyltransferase
MTEAELHDRVRSYYRQCLAAHGATPRGADWNSADSQRLRFAQLVKLCPTSGTVDLVDYGCGYGAFVDYLEESGIEFSYQGYDVLGEMVQSARTRNAARPHCCFTSDVTALSPADYAVASGVFNVRLDVPDEVWEQYLLDTLAQLNNLGTRGFAFNALTVYSDPDRRRADLYYADPGRLFEHCQRRFSRQVALLHDYGLYEFTILVRKDLT